jgi:hypothetical protein
MKYDIYKKVVEGIHQEIKDFLEEKRKYPVYEVEDDFEKRSYKKFTDVEKQKIKNLHVSGMKVKDIAAKIGRPHRSVWYVINKPGKAK